ncbi:MAG: tRNA pseudouridine(38-40) synthase TruA [Chloroflexota bacterium]
MARRIALVLEYEGTGYAGFQLQANAPSVQEQVELAVERLTSERPRLKGAGRTDAGVHALGQVVAFDTASTMAVERFRGGLNHYLPEDIAVVGAYEAPSGFDPRRQATARVYRYTLLERDVRSPLRRRFVHRVGKRVDLAAMAQALAYTEGERDFGPFSGAYPQEKSTVRRMLRTAVWREESEAHVELEGNAFLPQQVRRTVAAALEVGLGRMSLLSFQALADSGQRGAAARVLPPTGLCLRQVKYRRFPP